MTSRRWLRPWGAAILFAAGACAARPPVREAPPAAVAEPAGQGRAALGFVLESTLRARRIREDGSMMLLELADGATVIDGDRLQVHVRTSQDAHVYIAFCSRSARDPRYPGLKVFPERGAIRARGYETTIAPDRNAEIVLDDKPGAEALYLVVSRVELATSGSELADVIAAARQGHQDTDCGPPTAAGRPPKARRPSPTGGERPAGRASRPSPPRAVAGAVKQAGGSASAEEDPVVELQRGGDVVWNDGAAGGDADPEGVVVLRYGLRHVPAPRP